MPTFNVEIVEDQIIVVATITVPPVNPKTEPFKALVDTGAQVTMISQKVVDAIQADPVGQGSILPASGEPVETPQYRLGIHIAVGIGLSQTFSAGKELDVYLLPFSPPNYDVLLGMDILAGFHATMYGGHFILSN